MSRPIARWILLMLVAATAAVPVVSRGQEPVSTEAAASSASSDSVSADSRLEDILAGNAAPTSIDDLRAMQEHISALAEKIKLATVGINCGGAQGSGVIVSRDGLVLTAAHVIGQPGLDAYIKLADGKSVRAKTKGLNHLLDAGLLKITDPGSFHYLDMGESQALNLGQWVMALGHPGGYEESRGMVVRVGRILSLTSRVIRTDCTLVGGDSGGPLVDMKGNVVGIHSRIGARLSDNLHVPIDVYTDGWDDLESDKEIGGRPAQPSLGITLKGDEGLEIETVQPNGPADLAGIKPGDILLEVNGKEIKTRSQLGAEITQLQIGSEVDVKVLRGSAEHTLKVVVGRRPS